MTLSNGLWTPDAVYLWSDTAHWINPDKPQRQIVAHAAKIAIGEGWPYAFVTSGTLLGIEAVASAVVDARPRDFGELRDCIRSELADFVGKTGERTLIASFADKPRLTLIDTEEFGGHRPLTVMELRPFQICSNAGRPETMRLIDAGVTVDSMTDIIRAQHRDWEHDVSALIAGTICRARVTRFGVETTDIEVLPDPTMA